MSFIKREIKEKKKNSNIYFLQGLNQKKAIKQIYRITMTINQVKLMKTVILKKVQ